MEGKRLGRKDKVQEPKISATAKTIYGEIYECIDIDKQPAFDHPALRADRTQLGPSMEIVDILAERSSLARGNNHSKYEKIWLEKKGCPFGTVPIPKKTSKKGAKCLSPMLLSSSLVGIDGYDFAGIRVYPVPPQTKYYGASALVNIYAPEVKPQQFSAATVFVDSGTDQIQAGWMVNPDLNGDNNVRLYNLWTRDHRTSTGCYNTQCPGYVHVYNLIPVNYAFPKTSTQYEKVDVNITVSQADNGDWLFLMDTQMLGYWPASLFTTLKDGADKISFGGQVYTPTDNSPPMGSGDFFGGNYPKTCYMHQVAVLNNQATHMSPDSSHVEEVDSRCYYEGYEELSQEDGYRFLFGGRGGKAGIECFD